MAAWVCLWEYYFSKSVVGGKLTHLILLYFKLNKIILIKFDFCCHFPFSHEKHVRGGVIEPKLLKKIWRGSLIHSEPQCRVSGQWQQPYGQSKMSKSHVQSHLSPRLKALPQFHPHFSALFPQSWWLVRHSSYCWCIWVITRYTMNIAKSNKQC